MPTPTTIKSRLVAGETVRVMSLGALAHPKLVEIAAGYGDIHGFWIDQEHSAVSHERMETLMFACRAVGLDAFARVPPIDYCTVMRPMEAGCSGVMIAQVRNIDEVTQAVQWAKYPPRGVRGLFMGNFECNYGKVDSAAHVARANENQWLAIQIETVEAVDLVDEIAATDGVDLLFVGPGDLACNLGVTGQPLHAKSQDALRRVAAAAESHGKFWGTLCRDIEHARFCRDLNCRLFSIFGDIDVIHRGFQSTRDHFAELLG